MKRIRLMVSSAMALIASALFAEGENEEGNIINFMSLNGQYAFSVDCSEAPDLKEWAKTNLRGVLEKQYERLAADFWCKGYSPYKQVNVKLRAKMKNPGTAVGRKINLNASWIRKRRNDKHLGMVIHEMWHVLQRFKSKSPSWLREGLADYIRYYHYSKTPLAKTLVNPARKSVTADGKYSETASFLAWCARIYGKRFIPDLITALRTKRGYDGSWWSRRTGKSFGELAAEWKMDRAMNVATYNIRRAGDKGDRDWRVRLPLIVDVINKRKFDIVGFQEVFPNQLADLRKALSGWESFGRGRAADRRDEASPLFWNSEKFTMTDSGEFWLSSTPEKPGSKDWKAAFPRLCSWVKLKKNNTGREFYVFNTHLDYKSVEARQKSADLILERIKKIVGDAPVIFMGDFNDEIGTAEYRAEVRRKDYTILSPEGPDHPISKVAKVLKDSREVSLSQPKGTYWTDNGYGEKHVKRIDYIFVSDNFAVHAYETCFDRPDGKFPSDHEAVVTRLEL